MKYLIEIYLNRHLAPIAGTGFTNMLEILKNGGVDKPEMPTNFLNEIYNGKEVGRLTKEYLNSFSRERLETERQQRKTDRTLNMCMAVLIIFVSLLLMMAYNR